ncbi:MAG: hypothetical protein HN704_12570 [Bacteroidetes bacterium]|jgi:hypothetical protein|nr:hypothetical protein [Bacteroidota bacterium]MBT6687372.1 hypothetical protein [Bacteroidota bacterium]MBT7143923.1 hypothetical protein [Bacteroidota bacterium]MBT7492427.1 hypothetical protein [Bacteroidota bacterium]
MKKWILLLFGISFLYSCTNSTTDYSINDDKVFLIITAKTTKTELISISQEMKEKKNIDIDFSESEFHTNDIITKLALKVDCNDGFSGSTEASNIPLNLNNFGFFRTYSDSTDIPFSIGTMDTEM